MMHAKKTSNKYIYNEKQQTSDKNAFIRHIKILHLRWINKVLHKKFKKLEESKKSTFIYLFIWVGIQKNILTKIINEQKLHP